MNALLNPSSQHKSLIIALSLSLGGIINTSSTFIQYQETLPPSSENSGNLQEITQPNAVFYTGVFLNRNQTFISIPYTFSHNHLVMWLSLSSQEPTSETVRLISHPTLDKLDWPQITQDHLTLYQQKLTYESLTDFINHPPPPEQILMDYHLEKIKPYTSITQNLLKEDFNPDDYQYILTTYLPSRIENGTFYYETTLDATSASVNDLNELVWGLHAPQASVDNSFILGAIHVDYR